MAETRAGPRLTLAGSDLGRRNGLRVRPQRPARVFVGLLIVAACVVVVLVIYTRLGDRRDVLTVNRTVLAGEQLSDSDLRVISISSDDSFPSVPVSARASIVGQYARVRLAQGALLVADSVQARPLVDPSKVLMSVSVPLSGVPTGLREGSRLALIITPKASGGSSSAPVLIEATVAAVPRNLGELVSGGGSAGSSSVALTVEVDPAAATTVGPAESIAVAVLGQDEPFPSGAPAATADEPSTSPGLTGGAAPSTTVVGGG